MNAIQGAGTEGICLRADGQGRPRHLAREGFEQAETVALLLNNEALQKQAWGAVWWIDEAGLLSGRAMAKVAQLAERSGARVILRAIPASTMPSRGATP